MQEYDDNKAVKLMAAVLEPERRNEDAILEVLDLIFEYYDDNGILEIDFDEDDDSDDVSDVAEIVKYICRKLDKTPAEVNFTADEIEKMVNAEINYEESLQ